MQECHSEMTEKQAPIAMMFALLAGRIVAADIKVVSADVFTGVLDGIAREFGRTSGHKVSIDYHTSCRQ